MARNNYPERTVENIVSLSAKLFIEKGYDKTSIQDIINALGMSKGAIYHHFKSKEEILNKVLEQRSNYATQMFNNLLINIRASNAREKLVNILDCILSDNSIQSMNNVLISQIKNPQFVVTGIKDCIIKDAPKIAKIILQGKEDGSITTDYPSECAEVFMILLNVWINPVLFERNLSETVSRLKFLQQMMKQLGVDIVSDQLIQKTVDIYSDMDGCK
ncbi:TetR/AcrR family transcriptional regulator [Clostridium sp. CF011]|uniref:TetR/AcrR family transcriptional regulator n=1 Tax=Clostridium sp. CF011 TaxID=2843318 RepID=UPI001C0C1D75|nr:TetR/AcrR family transcriptional regulator [Clostridium sp. CF011]MBU3091479.1 TetR/AcrR family transcriptional regulator [Clostridium sp. CF011]WAG69287.1 TetR/AcrR family transcriptional regulator [Clostridium sp. CF011]